MHALQEQHEDVLRAVSHDLRTPLSIVQLQAERLQHQLAEQPAAHKAAESISTAARRITAMIGDLVESARLEAGHLALDLRALDLCEVIHELLARTSRALDLGRLDVALPAKLMVRADATALERVLTNLISNALKCSPPGTCVQLTATRTGDQAEVRLRDRGPGIPLEDVLTRGRLLDSRVIEERAAHQGTRDLAILVYTSGTTGERKGVMLPHANIVGNSDSSIRHIGEAWFHQGLMLSFLPLSHALERVAGYYLALRVGARIACAQSLDTVPQDMLEVHPTVLMSVPRVYEKLYSKVQATARSSPLKKALFEWATAVGKEHVDCELAGRAPSRWLRLRHLVADRLVFGKIRERLGGELRFAVTGGAPMRRDIAEFLRAAGLLVVEGYGMTETSPVLTVNGPDHYRFGSVGRVIPGVELRIAPEPRSERDGEILARGPNVMLGYFNKPRQTGEVLEGDGWLHTGDIGYLDADGYLYVTDRKKELIKTSGGKYVAPAPIEGLLNSDPLIEQSCVIGDRRKYCVALIVPRFEALERQLGRPLPADRSRLGDDPQVRALYDAAVAAVNAQLGHVEQIKRYALLPQELSHETGELTPTQKMMRRVIEQKHKELIDRLFPEE
jgi:long-chain acyl-CoA synthetase